MTQSVIIARVSAAGRRSPRHQRPVVLIAGQSGHVVTVVRVTSAGRRGSRITSQPCSAVHPMMSKCIDTALTARHDTIITTCWMQTTHGLHIHFVCDLMESHDEIPSISCWILYIRGEKRAWFDEVSEDNSISFRLHLAAAKQVVPACSTIRLFTADVWSTCFFLEGGCACMYTHSLLKNGMNHATWFVLFATLGSGRGERAIHKYVFGSFGRLLLEMVNVCNSHRGTKRRRKVIHI